MQSRDDEEHDERQGTDSPRQGDRATGDGGRQVIGTNDPAITPDTAYNPDWANHPDQSMAIETSQIRGSSEAFNPHFVMVPVETDRPSQDRSGGGDGRKKSNAGGDEKDRKSQSGKSGDAKKDQSKTKNDPNDDPGKSGGHPDPKRNDHPAQAPSLTRLLLFSGLVAAVCGLAGAWGYSYFFGSSKSDDQKSSGKDSDSSKSSDSSKKDSDSTSNDSNSGKLRQVEAELMESVKELREARSSEKTARHSEQETKAVLDFLGNTLLSAGRPGDLSLANAFWAGGQGKDLTLRKAVDSADSQVADAFGERPLAEASVREILGLAYLNLGDPPRAVKEYQRAMALREASQGMYDPATAACRNQLAVAYRLAGQAGEGGRLFDRNPESPAYASELAVRGATLLLQKNPAEAELKLRECLTLRQKKQPDDWTTFETESMLGEALLAQSKFTDAEPLLVSGYEGMKQREATIPSPEKPQLTKALERLVKLYEAWGKNEMLMKWRTALEKTKPQPVGP